MELIRRNFRFNRNVDIDTIIDESHHLSSWVLYYSEYHNTPTLSHIDTH